MAAHEYGHAFKEEALDNVDWSVDCTGHAFHVGTNLACAYLEGFATYHAAVTRGTYVSEIQTNHWYWNEYAGTDGSILESAFAALLHDITDPFDEFHDNLELSGSYVADVVATCDVRQDGSWIEARGTDHLVYCFERTVDPWVQDNYFQTRTGQVTDQSNLAGAPSGWSWSYMRELWLENLYGKL